jgi:hypothetical protein
MDRQRLPFCQGNVRICIGGEGQEFGTAGKLMDCAPEGKETK